MKMVQNTISVVAYDHLPEYKKGIEIYLLSVLPVPSASAISYVMNDQHRNYGLMLFERKENGCCIIYIMLRDL